MRIERLQYITHTIDGYTHQQQVEDVCKGGVKWIQLRMKKATADEIITVAKEVRAICDAFQATFILNDHVELVNEVNADGVHIGKEDMDSITARKIIGNDKIIGCTTNTIDDVMNVSKLNIDYIGLGPFCFTKTKEKLSPILGLDGYRHIISQMNILGITLPVIAIGGIEQNDIPSLMNIGIHGVALSGVIHRTNNIIQTTTEIINTIYHETSYNSR